MPKYRKGYQTVFEQIASKWKNKPHLTFPTFKNYRWDDSTKSIYLQYIGTFLRKLHTKTETKQETCRLDSSAIYNWISGHIKFTKSQFKHCSKSLIWPLGSHIWSLFAQIHMQSWPKSKLGKVIMCNYLGLSTFISPQYTILDQI